MKTAINTTEIKEAIFHLPTSVGEKASQWATNFFANGGEEIRIETLNDEVHMHFIVDPKSPDAGDWNWIDVEGFRIHSFDVGEEILHLEEGEMFPIQAPRWAC